MKSREAKSRSGPSKEGSSRSGGKAPNLTDFLYPSARLSSAETRTKDIRMAESTSEDEWAAVLSFYERTLPQRGWEIFESHRFADRGTLSFRHETLGTVTILAASEAGSTHIRVYLKDGPKVEGRRSKTER